MKIRDDDHIDTLIGKDGPFQTTVRTYNLCRREGVNTIGEFMGLTPAVVTSWRNSRDDTWPEIATIQGKVSEPRERPAKGANESQTSFTVRLLIFDAWWQGHDACCEHARTCLIHSNPYEEP